MTPPSISTRRCSTACPSICPASGWKCRRASWPRSASSPRRPTAFVVGGEVNYVGSRYLNKRNTALADGYFSLTLMGGYRFHHWELRVDGRNLTNERPTRLGE